MTEKARKNSTSDDGYEKPSDQCQPQRDRTLERGHTTVNGNNNEL